MKAVRVVVPPEHPQVVPDRRVSPLVALIAGVVIGAVVVGVVWLLVAKTGDSDGAGGDAAAACAALDRVGELTPVKGIPTKGSGLTPEGADRLSAARALAEAAARTDSQYGPLNDALKKAHQMILVNFRVNEESIGQLNEARRICAGL